MNIFYLDFDPVKCARYHVDKHVVKMIVEYAQLLSTAHRVLDGTLVKIKYTPIKFIKENNFVKLVSKNKSRIRNEWTLYNVDSKRENNLYAATHINHPSAVWVRENSSNYMWLLSLLKELLNEYTHRYHKIHKTSRIVPYLETIPYNMDTVGVFNEPAMAMPDHFQTMCHLTSYRTFYKHDKSHLHSWSGRDIPFFCN